MAMAIIPLLILIILTILLFIIFIVYFRMYKNKINKSLEQNESTAHISMVPAESIGRVLVIIGAVIFAISTMAQLSDIASDVQQTKYVLESEISNLTWQIDELEAKLEQQTSILNSFEYSLGKINVENNTVETTFRCVPKSTSEDTVVTVTLGDEVITLEANEGGVYTATKELPLFEDLGYEITVAVTTGGITNTQINSDGPYGALYSECLPQLEYSDMIMYEFEKGKLSIDGDYDSTCNKGELTDMKLFFVIDGNTVKTLEITEQITSISEEYEIGSNSLFELVAEGKDEYGYTHRKVLFAASETSEYAYLYTDTIIDKDGNILIG